MDPTQLRAIFTAEEVKLLHNQFRTARKGNDRVSTAFEEADKLGVREGKNKAKLGYVMAWLKDAFGVCL